MNLLQGPSVLVTSAAAAYKLVPEVSILIHVVPGHTINIDTHAKLRGDVTPQTRDNWPLMESLTNESFLHLLCN
jgi:hypothetical protein